jgi:hypothetical protein
MKTPFGTEPGACLDHAVNVRPTVSQRFRSASILWCSANIFVLVHDVIRREVRVVLHPEDVDDTVGQIALRIE